MTRNKITKISDSQAHLPFSRKSGSIFAYARPLERRAFFVSGIALLLLSVLYIYFMFSSVVHVAALQELAHEATKTSAEVANLETAYLTQTQNFTEVYAHSNGYVAIRNPEFVRKSSVVSFQTAR
ncbi:MAG: hypothetical protein V4437_00485 [Patescibacteria group bacterium]